VHEVPDKTPNLNLYKVNPETDGNDTFNIDLALNDNWDKIDEAVNAVEAVVADHSTRLDTAVFADVTLNPGVQIVNSTKTSRFSLGSIKGRTLINLLGRTGGFENGNDWAVSAQSAEIDKTVHADGSTQSLKITLGGVNGNINRTVNLTIGKTYLLAADVAKITTTKVYVSITSIANGNEITGNSFGLSFARFTATSTAHTIAVVGSGAAGQVFNVDNVRLYEVNADDYAALANMTPEQVAAKYPYVDSVQPVRNPYAIRYGENLMPPFTEWTSGAQPFVAKSPYEAVRNATAFGGAATVTIPVTPKKTYTLSYSVSDITNAYMNVEWLDAQGAHIGDWSPPNQTVQTVTAPDGAVQMRVLATSTVAGTFTFTNPMLTLGSVAKPFKPREDAMLALQTDVFADPLTGSTADEVFVRDGQYFKLGKWKKVILNGLLTWSYIGSAAGFKRVKIPITDAVSSDGANSWITKYDGSLVPYGDSNSLPNVHHIINSQGGLFLSIPSADSGWGDSYTPTADEIKAYFMGWRMCNYYDTQVYSGATGQMKCWGPIANPVNTIGSKGWVDYVFTVPTGNAPVSAGIVYTPYSLVYQLATPTVEPITSEGAITLVEGDNQVEVGTGLVVRESVQAKNDAGPTNWYLNAINGLGYDAPFKNKVRSIKTIYKNSLPDTARWILRPNNSSYYGGFGAYALNANYDQSTAYSVTYFMLDKSPIVALTGSAATNEKALLQDVTSVNKRISNAEAVAQQATVAAQQAFQSASDGKTAVASAITGKGVTASGSDTFPQLATKIGQISTGQRMTFSTLETAALTTTGMQIISQLPPGKIFSFDANYFKSGSIPVDGSHVRVAAYANAATNASAACFIKLVRPNGTQITTSLGNQVVTANSTSYAYYLYGFEFSNGVITPGVVQYRVRSYSDPFTWTAWQNVGGGADASEINQIVVSWTITSGDASYCWAKYALNGRGILI
jgi:hypothetical protein